MTEQNQALDRVLRLVRAAAEIADPASALGRRARAALPASTRLSAEGVEFALSECLETQPSSLELERLLSSVKPVAQAHVALPSNVFVAALRAIALALAESSVVCVRPSRREPHFARLLAEAAPGLYRVVPELTPSPGDSLWAYGTDATLGAIAARLPAGVRLHAHGPGFGVAVVDASAATAETARALASDVVPFEQRGCLSPRLVLFRGEREQALGFAELVAAEFRGFAERVPLGELDADEAGAVTRFRDTYAYAGKLAAAGKGFVACTDGETLAPAPVGRDTVIAPSHRPELALASIASSVTAVGTAVDPAWQALLESALPRARVTPLGRMQRPPLDGPADRRS